MATPTPRVLFLSLKPTFADLLLDGKKSVELRRVRPKAEAGTSVLIYASSPVRALVGTCVVEAIGAERPAVIWEMFGERTGLDEAAFHGYFSRCERAVAISVGRPRRLAEPVTIDVLRRRLPGFRPPQSFRYFSDSEARALCPLPTRDQRVTSPRKSSTGVGGVLVRAERSIR